MQEQEETGGEGRAEKGTGRRRVRRGWEILEQVGKEGREDAGTGRDRWGG